MFTYKRPSIDSTKRNLESMSLSDPKKLIYIPQKVTKELRNITNGALPVDNYDGTVYPH